MGPDGRRPTGATGGSVSAGVPPWRVSAWAGFSRAFSVRSATTVWRPEENNLEVIWNNYNPVARKVVWIMNLENSYNWTDSVT